MITIVQPLLPIEVPTGWMVLHEDQHRRSPHITPGIIGEQTTQKWLKPVVVRLVSSIENSPRLVLVQVVPPPVFITWLQKRFTLYDKAVGASSSPALAGGF